MNHKIRFLHIFLILNISLFAQSVNLPLDHWAYDFLDRMRVKGCISTPPCARPWSRQNIAAMVGEIEVHKTQLSRAETGLFEQLKGEFVEDLSEAIPVDGQFRERHLLTWNEGPHRARVDLDFDQFTQIQSGDRFEEMETESRTTGGGSVRGRFGNALGFYLFVKNARTSGTDDDERFNPSQGMPVTVSGGNAYADDASAYLVWQRDWLRIQFGRDRVQWGPGRRGSLMLSAENPRFDLLKIDAAFKKFRFTSLHGKLAGAPQKFIAAHRLEMRIAPWLVIAGTEAVVYGNRNIEPMYLNPLMPYHVAEHHLGDLDNNTLGLDIVCYPWKNHKLYAELFIDDMTSSRSLFNYFGNKFAFLTGWHWTDPLGLENTDMMMEYTRIEPYVYTHHDTINVYTHYDRSIGHWLGPDSDNFHARIQYLFSRRLQASVFMDRIRHGEGSINTPHLEADGDRKDFLSGVVETTWMLGGEARWQIFRDGFLFFQYTLVNTKNLDHLTDNPSTDHRIQLRLTVNY